MDRAQTRVVMLRHILYYIPISEEKSSDEVNGQAAIIIRTGGQALFVLSIEVEAERIQAIRIMANPEKLARI